jgi:5-methyltetrahydrofolate--homocysteine methyltransferase
VSRPLLIAQNLNSSDPAVAAALAAGDAGWLQKCARRIESTGVDFIDCNAGVFGEAEADILSWMLEAIEPMVRTPLSLDSADTNALVSAAAHSNRPVLINSLALDFEWSEGLAATLVGTGNRVVLSLRRGRNLPADANARWDRACEGVRRLTELGVAEENILVDAIALPWGDDCESGLPMIDFVERWSAGGRASGTIIGLGNIGYGHREAVRIHREWLERLVNVGLSAAILDAFEPGLRSVLPPSR